MRLGSLSQALFRVMDGHDWMYARQIAERMIKEEDWPMKKRRVSYILRNGLSYYVDAKNVDNHGKIHFKYRLKPWVNPDELNCYGKKTI